MAAETDESALTLLMTIDQIVEHLGDAAKNVGGELAQHLFEADWPAIVVTWVFRGSALSRTALRLDTEWLQREDRPQDWWRLVPTAWPPDFEASMSFSVWDTDVAREGAELVTAVAELWGFAAHLADLVALGEIDGVGEELTQNYVAATAESQSAALQRAIDAFGVIFDRLKGYPGLATSDERSLELRDACHELRERLLPPGFKDEAAKIKLSDVATWRDALAEAQTFAAAIHLLALTVFGGADVIAATPRDEPPETPVASRRGRRLSTPRDDLPSVTDGGLGDETGTCMCEGR